MEVQKNLQKKQSGLTYPIRKSHTCEFESHWVPLSYGLVPHLSKKKLSKFPFTDLKPTINKFIHNQWKKSWDDQLYKLNDLQDTVVEWQASYRRNRKEVILSKLYIGHTHITPSKREDTPICSMCKIPLTIKHDLLNCDSFRQTCPKYYQTSNIKVLFKNTKSEDILSFLKNTNLFTKIWPNQTFHWNLMLL